MNTQCKCSKINFKFANCAVLDQIYLSIFRLKYINAVNTARNYDNRVITAGTTIGRGTKIRGRWERFIAIFGTN